MFSIVVALLLSLAWPFSEAVAQSASFPQPEILGSKQGLPQGFIPAIVQDSRGFIWIATRDGLCRFDGHKCKVFQPEEGAGPSLSSLGLEGMLTGPNNKIWIVTDRGDIDVFDPLKETFTNYSKQPFYRKAFGKALLKNLFLDKQDRLWLAFNEPGIASIDLNSNKIKWYSSRAGESGSIAKSTFRDIIEDRYGMMWVATTKGIFQLAKNSDRFVKYRPEDKVFEKIDKKIYALKERHNGDFLLLSEDKVTVLKPGTGQTTDYPAVTDTKGRYKHYIVTDSKGNNYFHRMNLLYRFDDREGLKELPGQADISEFKSLLIDRSDVLWAGSNGQGVLKYNLRAGYFKALPYRLDFIKDLFGSFLGMPESQLTTLAPDLFTYNFRYTIDREQNIWFNGGRTPFYKFNPKSKQLSVVPFPVEIRDIKRADLPIAMSTDPNGRIWAVYDSLAMYYENGLWHSFQHKLRPQIQSGILQIVADNQALWIATTVKGLYRLDLTSGKIRQFSHHSADTNSLSSDNLYCLFSDPLNDNLLWVGTFGGGMCSFNKQTGHFRRLTKKNGLPNDVVYAAIPDRRGNVWVATNQGLSQVNRNTFKVRTYTREDGLMADEFNRFHFLQLPDDRIFLGGVEGITAFDPRQTNEDRYQPLIQITSIAVNNHLLSKGPLTKEVPISALTSLELNYDQNFITIDFAAMQFNRVGKIKYRYQLAELEEHWTETEEPVTKYTDLRPGKYVLRLNASNTIGEWSSQIRTLSITIHPPWWQTWWAYLLYAGILISIIYAAVQTYVNRLKLKQSIAFSQKEMVLKQKESEQLREVDEMKTRFFSNITHEFRTPLTLILAPTDQMLQEPRDTNDANRLALIGRNAQQLLGLVNQLLDLSKLESGTMKVAETQSDPAEFIEGIVQTFEITAKSKNIQLSFEADARGKYYWFDHEKLERIMNNLIANAVKFTNENGRVSIVLETRAVGVRILVSDTGIGVPPELAGHIFDRFFQAETDGYQQGSGIGLAIVKELIELQNGTIRLDNDINGFKTMFTLSLPYRLAAPAQKDQIFYPVAELINTEMSPVPDETIQKILLVEDNNELAGFIAGSFGAGYHFYHAENGQEGIDMALSFMPDLIISDVMMPVMDGYEFCQKIKSDLQTSHIPVILLTAKSAMESRLEGLGRGADDYITKPFHLPELTLRIKNLLQRQRRLHDLLYMRFASADDLSVAEQDEITDPFLIRLHAILDENLENPDFGVNELVREIGMSNSSLNRKLKALTGIAAVELIRNYRLKKAAGYLSDGMPISEAAYQVGFDNLSYFAKCFRDLFQMSPRDFAAMS
ncbi:hybrid sensor histidine kinase/response regulator transcription factor [Dyadobacter pollutisoli]|uniref:histidine kinase n=1 Tax=Dyadobacter pollutisoli TaxID=2910158 RepID=A0A9E8NEI8_9BACT|nr:ATP-binding protein [Dyadobacter pollutisoli]WAC12684.1 response regulator [Dyadobacter pollutisoli]